MMIGFKLGLSAPSFADRNRDGTAKRAFEIALPSDADDEIEDEREVRETSEIIDSGEEAVEKVESDGRRGGNWF